MAMAANPARWRASGPGPSRPRPLRANPAGQGRERQRKTHGPWPAGCKCAQPAGGDDIGRRRQDYRRPLFRCQPTRIRLVHSSWPHSADCQLAAGASPGRTPRHLATLLTGPELDSERPSSWQRGLPSLLACPAGSGLHSHACPIMFACILVRRSLRPLCSVRKESLFQYPDVVRVLHEYARYYDSGEPYAAEH